jgi:putative component of toxin-antitoxin plasmid stabilization module
MSERDIAFITRARESTVYVLLAAGVKASQAKDIAKAKQLARELRRAKS